MHHLPALTSLPMPRSSAVVRPSASAPIDDVALLDAQRAHRLGAVGHDAERRARRDHRFPHRAAAVAPARGSRRRARPSSSSGTGAPECGPSAARTLHVADGEERKRLVRHVDVDERREHVRATSARQRRGGPLLGHRGRVARRAPASRPAAAARDAASPRRRSPSSSSSGSASAASRDVVPSSQHDAVLAQHHAVAAAADRRACPSG